jgi:ABC-type spermidine/putrescine transport system permease subunit I
MMDSFMRGINQGVTVGYYAITLAFALALAWNLWKSRKPYESILYVIILIPFVLRLLRLK